MTATLDSGHEHARTARAAVLDSELHLASPPLAGTDVLTVQKILARAGYAPGRLDGVYGIATVRAVAAFQRRQGLADDGIVGPLTWHALYAVRNGRPATGIYRRPSSPGEHALAEACRHIGLKEQPAGSNRTMFGRWFGVDGVPWCNIFVSYCFKVGADYTLCHGFSGAGVYRNGCTYVPTSEAWLRATGMWVGRTTPVPGDIAIFNWDGGVPDHIGLVESNLAGGRFQTIEGNTAVGSDSNGGEVMRRLRYVTQVDGFGRIHNA
jgi:hypothetical protein